MTLDKSQSTVQAEHRWRPSSASEWDGKGQLLVILWPILVLKGSIGHMVLLRKDEVVGAGGGVPVTGLCSVHSSEQELSMHLTRMGMVSSNSTFSR